MKGRPLFMVDNNQQQNFEEDFKKNFAVAKKLSEENKQKVEKEAADKANSIFLECQSSLIDQPIEEIANWLKNYNSESEPEFSTKVAISDLNSESLKVIDNIIKKVTDTLDSKISALIGENALKIEMCSARPQCAWSKDVTFCYNFSL